MTDRTWKITFEQRFKDETNPDHPIEMVQVAVQTDLGFMKTFFFLASDWTEANKQAIIEKRLKSTSQRVV
jgi:hypothetical protein